VDKDAVKVIETSTEIKRKSEMIGKNKGIGRLVTELPQQ
jgi:hypothetical protein